MRQGVRRKRFEINGCTDAYRSFGLFPFDLIYRENGERKGICEGDVFDGSPNKFVVLNPECSYSATYDAVALEGTEDAGDDIEPKGSQNVDGPLTARLIRIVRAFGERKKAA